MGKLSGHFATNTDAARGQGRAHALALSQKGATVSAGDVAVQIDSVLYAMATTTGPEETSGLIMQGAGAGCVDVLDSADAVLHNQVSDRVAAMRIAVQSGIQVDAQQPRQSRCVRGG